MERYNEYGETISHYMQSIIDILTERGGVQSTDWVQLDTMAWNYWLWQQCKSCVPSWDEVEEYRNITPVNYWQEIENGN